MRVTKTGNLVLDCLLLLLFQTVSQFAHSQDYIVRAVITDELANPLANATISFNKQKTVADSSGFISQILSKGKYHITVTAVDHRATVISLVLTRDTNITVKLARTEIMLGQVTVTASQRLRKAQMSIQSLNISQLRKLPVVLGEIDPMKTITLLPGIKSGGEASAGIYVRGGGPDQNLVMLDGIPVYNPNHLLGFFSVFNGEAIKGVEVIKGGIPAEYGGRLSSVIAVDSREGNKDSLKMSGGIGLMASRLAVEGPLVKGKASYIFSARRTYIDQLGKLVARQKMGENGYFFYDLNGKIDYTLNSKNSISATIYAGKDNFAYADYDKEGSRNFEADWGNRIAGLTWKNQVSSRLRQQTSIVYNDFNLDSKIGYSTNRFLFTSGLRDYQLKNDWTYQYREGLKFKSGLQYTWHRFTPGAGNIASGSQNFDSEINDQYAREAAFYIGSDIDITDRLNIVAGLRVSYFDQVGPTENVIYREDGVPSGETEKFSKGQSIARYINPEPRVNLLYKLSPKSGLKLSYTETMQYLHLATTSAATFPSDLWIPSSKLVKPARARQLAAGYYRDLFEQRVALSVEAYYKTMENQIEFKPGAQLLLNQNLEGEMIFGKGKAYGMEVLIQKKQGRLTGWIGYTLSRAERTFAEMNYGKPFPFRYDRTHDLSVVASYRINRHWEGSAVFVYGTGNAITLPTGRFTFNTGFNMRTYHYNFTTINQYDKINDYRMEPYHRMDLAFTYTRRPDKTKGLRSSWNFSIYNVYNRANPYFIYLDLKRNEQEIQGKKVYLFPVLPSVTWNFKLG